MKKTLFVSQPFGIGDLLFIQKIIRHYADAGYRVVVPIIDSLAWMRYYLLPYEGVEYPIVNRRHGQWFGDFKFADIFIELYKKALFETDNPLFDSLVVYNGGDEDAGFYFLPISESYVHLKDKLMPAKYNFVKLGFADWVDHVHLKRRPLVERELYYDVLGLKDGARYTLVNEQSSRSQVSLSVPGNVVSLRVLDGFTLFDWLLVIERASQIVTIDTSLVLLVELLKLDKIPLHMVSRYDPPSFDEVKDILSLGWNFVFAPTDLRVEPVF